MQFETIILEYSDNVATVTLNQPDKLNSIGVRMIHELMQACDEIEQSGKARVIVFTGAGRAFCAGADLEDLQKAAASKPADLERNLRLWFMLTWRIKNIELPTIAAVNGHALGGGFALAIACDIRIAAEDARAGTVFVQRGASSADMGVSWILPRIVGAGWAAELMFTGDIIDAAKAERIGLFNHVVPRDQLMQTVRDMAVKLAAGPPLGLKFTKRALNRSMWEGLQGHLNLECATQSLAFLSDDFNEGVKSFYEKRPAQFKGS
ncbi:MAG: enoyl-CoA hydratase/isomerase family protein [Chloroflexi bacterium]|nr:MAG: enoyl-CoA hydratase/isomerase family protein [Chloroflexota bacterium]